MNSQREIQTAGVVIAMILLAVPVWGQPFAYITNFGDDTVSVIDTSTDTVVTTISVGRGPLGVAVHPDGSKVYITNLDSDTVSVIDTSSNIVTATIQVGNAPLGVAVHPDGTRIYVANIESHSVSIIDASNNTITDTISTVAKRAFASRPTAVAVTPDGKELYVGVGERLAIIDTTSNQLIEDVFRGLNCVPLGFAFLPDGSKLYIGSAGCGRVDVFDTMSRSYVAPIIEPSLPIQGTGGVVAAHPDGTKAYATVTFFVGSTLPRQLGLAVINTATDTITTIAPLVGNNNVSGTAVHPDGSKVYVIGRAGVSVIDTNTNAVIAGLLTYPANPGDFA